MSDATPSPLAAPSPDALTALFEADPTTLDDSALRSLISELRRRRSAFLSEEAAAAAKGKSMRTRPVPLSPAAAAALNKPSAEVSLDDLLDD